MLVICSLWAAVVKHSDHNAGSGVRSSEKESSRDAGSEGRSSAVYRA